MAKKDKEKKIKGKKGVKETKAKEPPQSKLPASVKALLQYMGGPNLGVGNVPVRGKPTETQPYDAFVRLITNLPSVQLQQQQQTFRQDVLKVLEEERAARKEQSELLKKQTEQLASIASGSIYGEPSKSLSQLASKAAQGSMLSEYLSPTKKREPRYVESLEEAKVLQEETRQGRAEEARRKKDYPTGQSNPQLESSKLVNPSEQKTAGQATLSKYGQITKTPAALIASPSSIQMPVPGLLESNPELLASYKAKNQPKLTRETSPEQKVEIANRMMGKTQNDPYALSDI